MATTFPTLGPFMKSLNTRWGTMDAAEASGYAMGSLPGQHSRATPTQSRVTPKASRHSQLASMNNSMGLRPDGNNYSFRVRTDQARRSSGSDDSERMIIRKTVSTSIQHEG